MQMFMGEGVTRRIKTHRVSLQTGGRKEKSDHFVAVARGKFTHGSPHIRKRGAHTELRSIIPC